MPAAGRGLFGGLALPAQVFADQLLKRDDDLAEKGVGRVPHKRLLGLVPMNKLTEQADGINWELEEIRKTLPELRTHIDLTPVQKSLTEMQRSLTEMNKLLERVGNLSEKYSSKWIDWLPDFSLLVALKWIMLVLILGTAALAGWYGAAAIRGLFL